MDRTQIDSFIINNTENFPSESIGFIRERLLSLPEDKWPLIVCTEIKRPIVTLIISFLVGEFGIDRFYLGQIGLGILKLITCGGFGIWWLIDLFLVMGETKEQNARRLMAII